MSKPKNVIYQYKDGRYLTTSYMGDGDYEIILTEKITIESPVPIEWELSDILSGYDGIYDESGECVDIEPKIADFEVLDIKSITIDL